MPRLIDTLGPSLVPFLSPEDRVHVVFMASNFDVSALDGGSTRIMAVTDDAIVVIRAGLLRRTTPYAVESRRALAGLRNPMFAWPGQTLYGEEYAEVLDGLWVHRRYRNEVVAAYERAVRASM